MEYLSIDHRRSGLGVVLIAALSWMGCNGGDSSSYFNDPGEATSRIPSSTPSGTATPTTSCTSSIVDYGQKGTVAAVGRGVYSDTELNPLTNLPSVAFADVGALALKFSYWDGNRFVTEIISGDGVATFVRLAFLSSGVPLVFWAQGVNVKVAIRSAAVGSAGTWTTGIIDTGTAPRSIEVAVNPLDQVAMIYATGTLAASRMKFAYCDAPCTGSGAFQTMSTTPYLENANILAAQVSSGIAWCRASASLYYPAVTYSSAVAVKYGVCRNNIISCLTDTNWTLQNIAASTSVSNKLYLDPTIDGDVPKVVAQGTTGIVTYKMGATPCTAAPEVFTAGVTLGGATSGNQWLSLMKDPSGKFHVVANETTAGIRYYNSTTTDFNGVWNPAGIIESITLAAAIGGGAVLDSSESGIYLSYGTGAAPFNIRLARVANYGTASNSGTFTKYEVDSSGTMQLTTATSQHQQISTASTSAGVPAVAYVDYSIGAVAGAKLKYALRAGSSSSSQWDYVLIPNTISPQFPALAFDHNNLPWISYFDAGNNRFYLATCSRTDGSGFWTAYEFPTTPGGGPVALPAANNTALAMNYSGGVASPVMIVINTNAGNRGVLAAKLTASSLAWSSVVTIDALAGLGASHISGDFDMNGNIVIAYRDITVNKAKYSYSTNGTTWSTPISVGNSGQGVGVSIRINPVTNKPAMAYYDKANNLVYYAPCSGSIATCASAGWSPTMIDNVAGVSGLVAGNEQVLSTGLMFSSTGSAYITFPRGQGTTGDLMMATNASGSFVVSTLLPGTNGALSGSSALNYGIAGFGVSATRNAVDKLTAVYIAPGNWLGATSCGD